jgi:hypothetical protein
MRYDIMDDVKEHVFALTTNSRVTPSATMFVYCNAYIPLLPES